MFCTKHNKPFRIVLIGLPGSGKGTQSSKLEKDYDLVSVSSGHLLRTEVAKNASLRKIAEQMVGGGLVSDDIMLGLIKEKLRELGSNQSWLVDGFPRNISQAEQLDNLLEEVKQPLTHVFYLKVPESVIFERLKERLVHVPSGRVYNLSFNPPKVAGKDDVTGEPLSRRGDDNVETIKARLNTYKVSTFPLLEFYKRKGTEYTIDSPTSPIGYLKIQKILDLFIYDTLRRKKLVTSDSSFNLLKKSPN